MPRLDPDTAATLKLGPFRAIADGSLQPGLTLLSTDIKISRKTASVYGDFASKTETTAPVYDAEGFYDVVLNAADVGADGTEFKLSCQVATSLGAWENYTVESAGLTEQQVRDAMKLAPTAGAPAADSIDDKLDTLINAVNEGTGVEVWRTSDVLTLGTPTGTSANTLAQDGAYWQITSVAGGIDAELVMNIGTANENPSVIRLWGRFDSGKNRVIQPQAYNFTTAAYENLGAAISDGSADDEFLRGLGRSFVKRGQGGTPGVDGDVRIRFLYDTTVSGKVNAGDNFYMDEVSVFYTQEVITDGELLTGLLEGNPQRNYPSSAIVINAEDGKPGTKYGVNGTPGNQSNNLADAIALAEKAGFSKFIINGNTNIVLTQAFPDWTFEMSQGSTIDINGQNIDNSSFLRGTLLGTAVAATTGIRAGLSTLKGLTAWGTFVSCVLPDAASLTANGPEIYLLDCRSLRPGAANPGISGGGVAGLSLSVVLYGGGIDISGLANDANVTLSGSGSYEFTDAASTATAIVSSTLRQIGALPTGFNFTETARVTQTTPMTIISDQDVNLNQVDKSAPAATQLRENVLASESATVNDPAATTTSFITTLTATGTKAYVDRPLTFTMGDLAKTVVDITAYDPGTKTVTVAAGVLPAPPADGDAFTVT